MLCKVVGSSTHCDNIMTLVVSKKVYIKLITSIVMHACEAEVLILIIKVLNTI